MAARRLSWNISRAVAFLGSGLLDSTGEVYYAVICFMLAVGRVCCEMYTCTPADNYPSTDRVIHSEYTIPLHEVLMGVDRPGRAAPN